MAKSGKHYKLNRSQLLRISYTSNVSLKQLTYVIVKLTTGQLNNKIILQK